MQNKPRLVKFKKNQLVNNKKWELDKDFIHDAYFHQIVATSEEVLAVIEMPDGTITTIEPEYIQFVEPLFETIKSQYDIGKLQYPEFGDYEPYGEGWQKSLKKLPKPTIIVLAAAMAKSNMELAALLSKLGRAGKSGAIRNPENTVQDKEQTT